MIQAVHFQVMIDDGELAKKLFSANVQFLASIVPGLLDKTLKTKEGEEIYGRIHLADNFYPDWAIDIFKANRDNPNVIWVQEGYRHCCGECFNEREIRGGKSPDPHHEHVCLNGHTQQTLEEQTEIILSGNELISGKLRITTAGYCPPNHLYNQDTLKVAEDAGFSYFLTRNGFDYFTKGAVKLPAYRDQGLIVLPESEYGSSPVKMAYYDRMSEEELNDFLTSPTQKLSHLPISDKPKAKVWLSEKLVRTSKKLRDIKNR